MRPRRQKGHVRLRKDKAIRPTKIHIPGAKIDADFTRKLIVAGQHTPERACDTKARFACQMHAEKAIRDIAAKYNDGQEHTSYPCPFCAGWHLAKVTAVLPALASGATHSPSTENTPNGLRSNS